MASKERRTGVNFRWQYYPRTKRDVALLKYIRNYPDASTTEVIMGALRAYYLPAAIANDPNFDEQTKQQIAKEGIAVLVRRLSVMSAELGVPLPNMSGVGSLLPTSPTMPQAVEDAGDSDDKEQLLTSERLRRKAGYKDGVKLGSGLGNLFISSLQR